MYMKKFNLFLATLLVVAIVFSVNAKHRPPQTRQKDCKCETPHHRKPQVREKEEYPRNDGHHRPPQTKGSFKGKAGDGKTAYVVVGRLLTPYETELLMGV